MQNYILKKNLNHCIDSIVETEDHIVLGAYDYNGYRTGKLMFFDRNIEYLNEFETTGTFNIFAKNNLIYAANCEDISVYNVDSLIKTKITNYMNTFIFCGSSIFVSDTSGHLNIYDYELNLIDRVKFSNDTIWVVKEINGLVFIGCEDGNAFQYNPSEKVIKKIGSQRLGILDFFVHGNNLIVSSYDDNLELYELHSLEKSLTIKNVGSCWKIESTGDNIFCACIYDGIKILDMDFNIIKKIPVSSICYGLCLTEKYVYWSCFYSKTIFWALKKKLIENNLNTK